MPAWLAQPGIILFTENFDACVHFYRDLLELPALHDKGHLITLEFGSGYLMIERDGSASPTGKTRAQNPTVLRFNVDDVQAAAAMLRSKGVAVEVMTFDWGTIGAFHDPDGNRCELKNQTAGFMRGAATPS